MKILVINQMCCILNTMLLEVSKPMLLFFRNFYQLFTFFLWFISQGLQSLFRQNRPPSKDFLQHQAMNFINLILNTSKYKIIWKNREKRNKTLQNKNQQLFIYYETTPYKSKKIYLHLQQLLLVKFLCKVTDAL